MARRTPAYSITCEASTQIPATCINTHAHTHTRTHARTRTHTHMYTRAHDIRTRTNEITQHARTSSRSKSGSSQRGTVMSLSTSARRIMSTTSAAFKKWGLSGGQHTVERREAIETTSSPYHQHSRIPLYCAPFGSTSVSSIATGMICPRPCCMIWPPATSAAAAASSPSTSGASRGSRPRLPASFPMRVNRLAMICDALRLLDLKHHVA